MTTVSNPKISSLLRFLTFVEVVVLFLAGCGMFFLPKVVTPFWPWTVAPFNASFLGAVYTAAMIAAVMQTAYARWSPTRIVTPMIFIFTLIILLLSLVHLNRFDFHRPEVWIWFLLYIIIPINAGVHIILYRQLPPADATSPYGFGKNLLRVQGMVLGVYGSVLLAIPSIAGSIWPWKIDIFHAQLYSVTFLTPALGALVLMKAASKLEWFSMGLTQSALGLFPLIGLLVVDASEKRVSWDSAGVWIWIILFLAIFVIGLWMLGQAQKSKNNI
jgi:hypothetical protein